MTVSEVKLTSQGASGAVTGDSPENVSASYNCTYFVKCDSQSDAPSTVLLHFMRTSSLPWSGRPYRFGNGFDFGVVCESVTANYIDKGAGAFTVNCSFKSVQGSEDQQTGKTLDGKDSPDPTKWHDEIEISFQNVTIAADFGQFRGLGGGAGSRTFRANEYRAVTNSAGVPFNPPIEKQRAIRVLRITKNSRTTIATLADKYINAVNSDSFTINKPDYGFSYKVDKYCAKINGYSTAFAIENGYKFWRESIEVYINPNTWRRAILDAGYHRRQMFSDFDDTGATIPFAEAQAAGWVPYTTIKDKNGDPISTPVMLNGNGRQLRPGESPVYIYYSIEDELPFSGIKW